jgi:hypothetical protein
MGTLLIFNIALSGVGIAAAVGLLVSDLVAALRRRQLNRVLVAAAASS